MQCTTAATYLPLLVRAQMFRFCIFLVVVDDGSLVEIIPFPEGEEAGTASSSALKAVVESP
jgi:hypothetical protein